MTDVASLDLCKELYELSGWETDYTTKEFDDKNHIVGTPAYSLGYLLRKLPRTITDDEDEEIYQLMVMAVLDENKWLAGYDNTIHTPHASYADTPENALCKLAIELIKSGVLKV